MLAVGSLFPLTEAVMAGLVDALVIVAVAVVVIVRQFRPSRVDTDRRWWVLPGILAVVALREPGLLDAHRHMASAAVLGAELLVGVAMGAGWACTTRIWAEPDGAVWSKSTKASAVVWIAGLGLRVGLFVLGAMVGIHQNGSALLLALAATLLIRSGILMWRVSFLHGVLARGAAYGGHPVPRSAWKERV